MLNDITGDNERKNTHCSDVIMGAAASQITGVSIVYSTACPGTDKRKHQSSATLAFVRGIHRSPVISSQMVSNAEKVSIWWRHHDFGFFQMFVLPVLSWWLVCCGVSLGDTWNTSTTENPIELSRQLIEEYSDENGTFMGKGGLSVLPSNAFQEYPLVPVRVW